MPLAVSANRPLLEAILDEDCIITYGPLRQQADHHERSFTITGLEPYFDPAEDVSQKDLLYDRRHSTERERDRLLLIRRGLSLVELHWQTARDLDEYTSTCLRGVIRHPREGAALEDIAERRRRELVAREG